MVRVIDKIDEREREKEKLQTGVIRYQDNILGPIVRLD